MTTLVGPFTTSGNRILDANAKPVVFRGVKGEGSFGGAVGPQSAAFVSELDLGICLTWGIDVRVLHLDQGRFLSGSIDYDPTIWAQLDVVVARYTGAGIFVILNNYATQEGNLLTHAYQGNTADDLALGFLTQLATRYQANHLVGFEVFNETHNLSDTLWRNGGVVPPATWFAGPGGSTLGGWHTPGMQALVAAIRGTGAQNLIFVGANSWGNDLREVINNGPIAGTNIVYAVHTYNFGSEPALPAYLATKIEGAFPFYPVMDTEFGIPSSDNGGPTGTAVQYINNIVNWCETHGIGWAAYAWYDYGDLDYSLLLNNTNYIPTWAGGAVYAALGINRIPSPRIVGIPTISGVTPRQGPSTGGTAVTITGAGFTGTTQVIFGFQAAVSFTVDSDTQITAVSPPNNMLDANSILTTQIIVDLIVVNGSGPSAPNGFVDQFEYSTALSVSPTTPDPMTINENLRMLLGERIVVGQQDVDTMFTDDEITGMITRHNGNLYLAASEGWMAKAGEFASMVDVNESGSSRSLSQLFKQALNMSKLYEAEGLAAWQSTLNRPVAKVASYLDSRLGGPNENIHDPVIDPAFNPWMSGTARFWPMISILT